MRIVFALLLALLLGNVAVAQTGAPPSSPMAGVTCSGSSCKGNPNTSGNPFYVSVVSAPVLPTGAATSANQVTEINSLGNLVSNTTGLALDTTSQSILTRLNTGINVALTGTLPAYAVTPTFNLGTLNGAATASNQATGNSTSASILALTPALNGDGGALSHVANFPSGFLINGTLPAYAATPTFNLGTLNGAATDAHQTNVQSAPGTPQTQAVTIQGNASGVAVPVSGTVTITPSGTQTVTGTVALSAGSTIIGKAGVDQTTPGTTNAVTTTGFPLANTVTPYAVTASSTSVSGLTLPGKVRFQASPVVTLGAATGSTVSIQISYTGGNACSAPNVILGPGQIDDWVYIPGSTAPTACAATTGGTLLTVQ